MLYAWTGINLDVDLSRGNIQKQESDPKLAENYFGGKGTNVKILWDNVPPEVTPFSPDNLLIIGTGVLVGTLVPAANHGTITTTSPPTNLHVYSNFGGFFPAELKHAGYDTIIIRGKSPTPVYLWINNDKVEIRDASHLWGKDTRETQRIIREELKNTRIQVACIGQAGENKVYAATIEMGSGASASRGVGCIMGSKKLKAIAVYGTKDIHIARPSRLIQSCEEILKKIDKLREFCGVFSYPAATGVILQLAGCYGNVRERKKYEDRTEPIKIEEDFYRKYCTREVSCYNCPVRCKAVINLPEQGPSFLKCGPRYFYLFANKLDFYSNMKLHNLCEKYGLDSFSTPLYSAFAIELYEKGILTKEDTGGMHLQYGNEEVAVWLYEKIARREGIGDILANGTYEAARRIGKGAEQYAHHNVKKIEQIPLRVVMQHPLYALMTSVSDKADMTRVEKWYPQFMFHFRTKESKRAYIEGGFFNFPKEFEKWFLADDAGENPERYEELINVVDYGEHISTISDLAGICYFLTGFFPYPPYKISSIANLISYATGMDIDETQLLKVASRVENLVRAYNIRKGMKRKDETVPERYLEKDQVRRGFNKSLDEYYKLKGWNSEGIPTKETLDKLDLNYVRQDLEQRGILSD